MVRPSNVCRLLASLAILSVALAGCSSTDVPKFLPISGRAPEISGASLLGGAVTPADYRGEVLVVNFWNYDCAPCHLEQPVLQADWEQFRSRGVFLIGLMYVGGGFPDNRGAARAYLGRFGVTYPAIVDQTSSLTRAFGIPGIPSTVVVDRTGRMRFRLYGRVRPGELGDVLAMLTPAG